MKNTIPILILILSISSCGTNESSQTSHFKTFVTDTIKLMPYSELDLSRIRSEKFNLPDITKGVDSFELRIWISSNLTPDYFTILRYSDDGWVGHKAAYFESDKELDSAVVRKLELVDSVEKVMSFLSDSSVLNLPSQHAIPDFIDNVADGQSCTIEIATKGFYKALHYHCPEHFVDTYNKRFMVIVNYLNEYLNFYTPWCKPAQ
jgi:hypothetical protein